MNGCFLVKELVGLFTLFGELAAGLFEVGRLDQTAVEGVEECTPEVYFP